MDIKEITPLPLAFDWDKWNIEKNLIKHKIAWLECEQVFFNKPIAGVIILEKKYQERQFYAFGVTDIQKELIVIFTMRKDKIRIISARPMSKKEREAYRAKLKESTQIQK